MSSNRAQVERLMGVDDLSSLSRSFYREGTFRVENIDPEKQTYDVFIAGLSLKVKSSLDEETVAALASLVDKKIDDAVAQNKNISFQNALLLAALHLAEDLILTKRRAWNELGKIESQAQEILSELESSPISRVRLEC